MKKIFLSTLMLFLMVSVFAQEENKESSPADVATQKLVQLYNLDKNQTAEMLKIQTRKLRNEADIASLKDSNPDLYLQKMKANEGGTNWSIRKMLNEKQVKIFQQEQHNLRTKRAAKANELLKAGKTPREINQAVLEIKN